MPEYPIRRSVALETERTLADLLDRFPLAVGPLVRWGTFSSSRFPGDGDGVHVAMIANHVAAGHLPLIGLNADAYPRNGLLLNSTTKPHQHDRVDPNNRAIGSSVAHEYGHLASQELLHFSKTGLTTLLKAIAGSQNIALDQLAGFVGDLDPRDNSFDPSISRYAQRIAVNRWREYQAQPDSTLTLIHNSSLDKTYGFEIFADDRAAESAKVEWLSLDQSERDQYIALRFAFEEVFADMVANYASKSPVDSLLTKAAKPIFDEMFAPTRTIERQRVFDFYMQSLIKEYELAAVPLVSRTMAAGDGLYFRSAFGREPSASIRPALPEPDAQLDLLPTGDPKRGRAWTIDLDSDGYLQDIRCYRDGKQVGLVFDATYFNNFAGQIRLPVKDGRHDPSTEQTHSFSYVHIATALLSEATGSYVREGSAQQIAMSMLLYVQRRNQMHETQFTIHESDLRAAISGLDEMDRFRPSGEFISLEPFSVGRQNYVAISLDTPDRIVKLGYVEAGPPEPFEMRPKLSDKTCRQIARMIRSFHPTAGSATHDQMFIDAHALQVADVLDRDGGMPQPLTYSFDEPVVNTAEDRIRIALQHSFSVESMATSIAEYAKQSTALALDDAVSDIVENYGIHVIAAKEYAGFEVNAELVGLVDRDPVYTQRHLRSRVADVAKELTPLTSRLSISDRGVVSRGIEEIQRAYANLVPSLLRSLDDARKAVVGIADDGQRIEKFSETVANGAESAVDLLGEYAPHGEMVDGGKLATLVEAFDPDALKAHAFLQRSLTPDSAQKLPSEPSNTQRRSPTIDFF